MLLELIISITFISCVQLNATLAFLQLGAADKETCSSDACKAHASVKIGSRL